MIKKLLRYFGYIKITNQPNIIIQNKAPKVVRVQSKLSIDMMMTNHPEVMLSALKNQMSHKLLDEMKNDIEWQSIEDINGMTIIAKLLIYQK